MTRPRLPSAHPRGVRDAPRILAVDLSLTSTGLALPDGTVTRIRPGGLADPERLGWIRERVHTTALDHLVDLVAIEGFSYGSKGRAVYQIGGLGWIVRLCLREGSIPYVEIPPSTLKRYATGKGNAGKDLVLVEAVKRLGYAGSSNDEADALWLRALALDAYGHPVVEVPASHRQALDKVTWPAVNPREAA